MVVHVHVFIDIIHRCIISMMYCLVLHNIRRRALTAFMQLICTITSDCACSVYAYGYLKCMHKQSKSCQPAALRAAHSHRRQRGGALQSLVHDCIALYCARYVAVCATLILMLQCSDMCVEHLLDSMLLPLQVG